VRTAYWKVRDGYPLPNCEEAWKVHARWAAYSLWMGIGILPFTMGTFAFEEWLSRFIRLPDALTFLPVLFYLAVFVIVAYVKQQFRCPRCGARFYRWGPWGIFKGGIVRECYNCGLKKWACPEESVEAPEIGGIVIRPRH